jgi:hypothetical protein
MKAIRNAYAEHGVEAYYREHGDSYENPHIEQIRTLITRFAARFSFEEAAKTHEHCADVFDLACGGGEVTLAFKSLGIANILASDPYTQALYERRTQNPCLGLSFEDIVRGKLSEAIGEQHFSAVVSSFAMHLCPEKMLYTLASQLFLHTENLIVITPHKRPELENYPSIICYETDFACTKRGKKVFLKHYKLRNF